MAKKNFIIDTNVFLSDSECLSKFDNNDIFIPVKVLEELDKHKKRQDSVGFHARQTIKKLDAFREKGSLSTGVRLGKGLGIPDLRPLAGLSAPAVLTDALGYLRAPPVEDPDGLGLAHALLDSPVLARRDARSAVTLRGARRSSRSQAGQHQHGCAQQAEQKPHG